MSNEVIIKNAVKRYGDFQAINSISLTIREGEFFTLLGPSGCGKTTLLRMIAGFNSIEGGDFYFGDRRINDVPAYKRDIGMLYSGKTSTIAVAIYQEVTRMSDGTAAALSTILIGTTILSLLLVFRLSKGKVKII